MITTDAKMQKVFVILLISLSTCLSKPADPATGQDVAKHIPVQEAPKTEVPAISTVVTTTENKATNPSTKPSIVPQKANATVAPTMHENTTQALPTNQTNVPKTEGDNKTTDKKEEAPKTDAKKEESNNATVVPAAKEQAPKSEGTPAPQETKPKVEPVPPKSDVTPKPNGTTSTTVAPKADGEKPTLQARGFDGPSFIGGIILTLGLLAIGFMGFKYYKNQTERNYHTL